ncbi:MAG TPA: hypothetical protein VGD27_01880 [Longimicrobiales bacterium]
MNKQCIRISCAVVLGVSVCLPAAAPGYAQDSSLPGRVLDIKVGEYFINAPDSVPAGLVTLSVTQTGDATKPFPADTAKLRADLTYHFHMVWLVRLDSAKTVSDFFEAQRNRAPTPWAKTLGGAGFADLPAASNVSMLLAPGNYVLVCYVGSAREDRNRYHLLKGMLRPLTVVARANKDTLPAAQMEIVLRPSSIEMPDTIAARSWRFAVRNERDRPADFGVARIKQGFTVAQALAWRPPMMTEPPRQAVGGVVYILPQNALITTVKLEPGDYLFSNKHVVVR